MKKNTSVSIPKPCSEKWDNFTPAKNGGFCSACSKTVIDFTKMSDREILAYLKHKQDHTCGRFRFDQLKVYTDNAPLKINFGLSLLKSSCLSLLLVLISKQTFAQNIPTKAKTETVQNPVHHINGNTIVEFEETIKGIVISEEDKEPIPAVNIYLKGSTDGTSTDAHGRFEFPKKLKEGDVLVFSFIGFETKEYVIMKDANTDIELHMAFSMNAITELVMMGEVAVDEVYTTKQSNIRKFWWKVKNLF